MEYRALVAGIQSIYVSFADIQGSFCGYIGYRGARTGACVYICLRKFCVTLVCERDFGTNHELSDVHECILRALFADMSDI